MNLPIRLLFGAIFFAILSFSVTTSLQAQNTNDYKLTAIGFYNLENLFDTIDNPLTNDESFLPSGEYRYDTDKYMKKMGNMARVLQEIGTDVSPDGVTLIGVAEVENRKVLEDLVAHPLLSSRNWGIVHYDSPDERGIDVAMLYNPRYFKLAYSKAIPLDLWDTKDSTKRDYTRDMLHVVGTIDGDTFHILVNHWPSRSGGQKATDGKRIAAAKSAKLLIDSLQAIDPEVNLVLMGDLNDDPTNTSVKVILDGQYNGKKMDIKSMYNPCYNYLKDGTGTLAYNDSWNFFDQLLVTKPLISRKIGPWFMHQFKIFRASYLFSTEGKYKGYPLRTFSGATFLNGYSDHLPVYAVFLKKR